MQGEGEVLEVFVLHFHNGKCHSVADVKCLRFVCEKLTTFPFRKHIVGKLDSCAFWRYIRFAYHISSNGSQGLDSIV